MSSALAFLFLNAHCLLCTLVDSVLLGAAGREALGATEWSHTSKADSCIGVDWKGHRIMTLASMSLSLTALRCSTRSFGLPHRCCSPSFPLSIFTKSHHFGALRRLWGKEKALFPFIGSTRISDGRLFFFLLFRSSHDTGTHQGYTSRTRHFPFYAAVTRTHEKLRSIVQEKGHAQRRNSKRLQGFS